MPALMTQGADNALAFELIEAAVQETGRGRWFLSEYARRNRNSDTLAVLDELKKVQDMLSLRISHSTSAHVLPNMDILDIGRAIARTERDIRAIQLDDGQDAPFLSASDALDHVVETTQKATSSILSAAERIQEYAWTMREKNGAEAECDLLDSCASEIYVACGFQDLTAQRIRKVMETLRFVDQRVSELLEKMGLAETLKQELVSENGLAGSASPSAQSGRADDIWMSEAHQAEIDETFEFFTPAEVQMEPTMVGAEMFDVSEESEAQNISPPASMAVQAQILPSPSDQTPASTTQPIPPLVEGEESAVNYEILLSRVEEMRKNDLPKQVKTPEVDKKVSKQAKPTGSEAVGNTKEAFDAYDGLSAEERLRSFR